MKVINLKEKSENNCNEPSYRNGYHQGYVQALYDIKFGKDTNKFTKYDGDLMRWRYGKKPFKKRNELQIPPSAK